MSLEKSIQSWFDKTWGGGLVLPNGWFGRPHDNIHQLTKVIESSDSLEVILDDQLNLKFEGLPSLEVAGNELIISSFDKLVFDWKEYGSMKAHSEEYSDGEVRMIAPPGV